MFRWLLCLLIAVFCAPASAAEEEKTCSSATDPFAGKTIKDSKMGMQMIMHRNANAPKPGQLAPKFDLPAVDGKERFELASLRNKSPVVLVFGSYT